MDENKINVPSRTADDTDSDSRESDGTDLPVTEICLAVGFTSLGTFSRTFRDIVGEVPTVNLPDGDVAVCWQRCRDSHPLTRRPSRGGSVDGPILTVAKPVPLRAGVGVALPFELPLPVDAAPTARAVHSSMRWFVQARMFYAGFTGPLTERVVHPIVVVNDP